METTENYEMQDAAPALVLTPEAQGYLQESGKWASFLGIVGFIMTAFVALGALSIGAFMTTMSNLVPDRTGAGLMAGMSGFLTVIYLLVALLNFFYSLYLYQFGSQIKKGVIYSDPLHVTSALGKLKSFFKLWGILTIVSLCLIALGVVCLIIFSLTASSMMNR